MGDKPPFGDDSTTRPRRVNPFGDDTPVEASGGAVTRIEQAARRIRGLRAQLGSEGLTPAATREMIDELTAALDAIARALREIAEA